MIGEVKRCKKVPSWIRRGSVTMSEDMFIKKAVRWCAFLIAVQEARSAFADVSPKDLQKAIDKAVDEVRSAKSGTRSVNYNP